MPVDTYNKGEIIMKKLVTAACVASFVFALAPSAALAQCDPGEIVSKFSHVTNTDKHPKGIAAALLAERVNKEMNGKMCMEVFPSSTLYNDNKVLEAMLQGDVQLAAPSLSKFEKFTKAFRIFDLPFLFANIKAVEAFQASPTGQALLDSMQSRGLQGLGYWHNGMKQISANKPLIEPQDANGLKFRVMSSDVLIAQIEALGASPQKMAFSEVYGALQQGVVDGQENTWSNIYGKKFFEVQDGVTHSDHGILDYLVVTSVDWLESLPKDVREQFLTIFDEVTTTRNKESTRVNLEAKQAILDSGGIVREITAAQRDDWIKAMKPVWSEFMKDVGSENLQAAQKINARFK